MTLRLGDVPYLNTKPLTIALEGREGVELRVHPPSRLSDMLREGSLDGALVSSFALVHMALGAILIHMIPHFTDVGLSPSRSALALSIAGLLMPFLTSPARAVDSVLIVDTLLDDPAATAQHAQVLAQRCALMMPPASEFHLSPSSRS